MKFWPAVWQWPRRHHSEQRASGSGVIISDDGYIVTNNHVVQNADELTVTLNNKKTYKKPKWWAPTRLMTWLWLKLKRQVYLFFIWQLRWLKNWMLVLAIGYPLNLETTVTAGIVIAKAKKPGFKTVARTEISLWSGIIYSNRCCRKPGQQRWVHWSTLDGKLVGINSAITSPRFITAVFIRHPVNTKNRGGSTRLNLVRCNAVYLSPPVIWMKNWRKEWHPLNARRYLCTGRSHWWWLPMPQAFAKAISSGWDGIEVTSSAELQGQVNPL